ncbi:hypothetical protein H2248_006531 [Termitomyces sp. 'cryptogamus']|nr:hypothetical protein H2248_006531 [Termitomyces sp. 'cryptogamus']
MSTPSKPASSEDILGQKSILMQTVRSMTAAVRISQSFLDYSLISRHQVADFLVKVGVGFSVGVVASVILFRRRTWPIALSTGFGAGAAYADCDRSFNSARVPGTRIVSPSELASSK